MTARPVVLCHHRKANHPARDETARRTTNMTNASTGANKSTRAKARIGKKAVVGYFSQELSSTLHDIADDEGTRIQALIGESIDMLLVDRGRKPLGER